MDSGHVLHGHPPSMSCECKLRASAAGHLLPSTNSCATAIATVILHTSVQESPVAGSPVCDYDSYLDRPEEAYIPLPPSPPGSECSTQDVREVEDMLMLDGEEGPRSSDPDVPEDGITYSTQISANRVSESQERHEPIEPEQLGMLERMEESADIWRKTSQAIRPEIQLEIQLEIQPEVPPKVPLEMPLKMLPSMLPDTQPDTQLEMQLETQPEAQPETQPELFAETQSETLLDAQSESQPEAQRNFGDLKEQENSEQTGLLVEQVASTATVDASSGMRADPQRTSPKHFEDAHPQMPYEEGPGLRMLGIPSDASDGHETPTQETPTQDIVEPFPLGIDGILEIFRRSHHEAKRCSLLKEKAYEKLHRHGRQKRLAPVLLHRRYQLVRCHREDAPEFASLYAEIPVLEAKQHDSTVPPSPSLSPNEEASESGSSRGPSWIAQLPSESGECLLQLLDRIREDEDFLAERIVCLPPVYLEHLSRLHSHGLDMPLLARPFGGRNSSRPPSRLSHVSDSYENIEAIKVDPLQVMIHSFFDKTASPDSTEYLHRERIWASVCSKLINHDVQGADRLVIAVLSEFAYREPWQLGPQLETLMLKWIQSGASILDPDAVSGHKGESEEARVARIAADQTRLVENAFEQFLELLAQDPRHSIPRSCMQLIRSTMAKVDDGKKDRAKRLFFSSWYGQTYLNNALVCPEQHGIMQKQHLRRDFRTKILQGVSAKLKTSFEAVRSGCPRDNGFVSPVAMDRARVLLELLISPRWPSSNLSIPILSDSLNFLSITAEEMLHVISTLFPQNDKSPDPSGSTLFGKAFSATSSTTGGSRATTVGSLTPMLRTISSVAPSTSSTSITSDTFFSDHPSRAETTSTGISDDNAAFFHHGGLRTPRSDSRIMSIACELRSLIDSLSSRKLSDSRAGVMDGTAAIFFLTKEGLSLKEPEQMLQQDHPEYSERTSRSADSDDLTLESVIRSCLMDMATLQVSKAAGSHHNGSAISGISDFLADKFHEAQASYDFVSALHWHQAASIFESSLPVERISVVRNLTLLMESEARISDARSDMYEGWMVDLTASDKTVQKQLREVASDCKALRDKQWFATAVCHSSEYMDALNVSKALATMATGKSNKQGGIAGFVKRKLKFSFGSEKAQAQALAMLSASKQHGGPCKLTDAQAELTADWLTNHSIENFCGGEERLHRFCYEVQRCTQKLVADTMIASPVLWSSSLFEKEKADLGGLQAQRTSWSVTSASPTSRQSMASQSPTLQASSSRIFPFSLSPSHSRQNTGIRDFTSLQPVHARPSILDSSIRFSTPPENALGLQTPFTLPPSPVSPGASVQRPQLSPRQKTFLVGLRQTVTSLLLSDLSLFLWPNGTETDRWVNEERLHHESVNVKIGSPSHPDLTQLARLHTSAAKPEDDGAVLYRSRRCSEPPEEEEAEDSCRGDERKGRFPYEDAYVKLLTRFQLSPDPFQKLNSLYELVRLISIGPDLSEGASRSNSGELAAKLQAQYAAGLPDRNLPRTGLTKLQEATLNCEERRIQALTLTPLPRAPAASLFSGSSAPSRQMNRKAFDREWIGDPKITNVIQALLLDRAFYPSTLFRDLQLISAFVPSSFLDASREGAAFWTLGLAAMQLKSALCAGMIDRAAQITNFHVDRGNKAREPVRQDHMDSNGNCKGMSDAEPEGTASAAAERHRAASPNRNYQSRNLTETELRMTSLADAGRLFRLAALEGDPAAARELGLFYLTHPEHVRRTLKPLSKPSDVARMAGSAPTAGPERVERRTSGIITTKTEHGTSSSYGGNSARADDSMSMDVDEVPVDGRDPTNLATAWHWMESAADGGDMQAKTFLMNNTELRWDAQGRRI